MKLWPIKDQDAPPRRIRFEEILPIWAEKLWPGRQSAIEEVSMIRLGGGYVDRSSVGPPTFLGIYPPSRDELPIAVSSGFRIHATGSVQFRIRGTWVHPEHRKTGLGSRLLEELLSQAKREGANLIWTLPRKSSWPFYESLGFVQAGDWTGDYEFGPNCFATKLLV